MPECLRVVAICSIKPLADVLVGARDKHAIEPLLRASEPDLMLCWGFPWKTDPGGGARRVECGDGPIWVVSSEPV